MRESKTKSQTYCKNYQTHISQIDRKIYCVSRAQAKELQRRKIIIENYIPRCFLDVEQDQRGSLISFA